MKIRCSKTISGLRNYILSSLGPNSDESQSLSEFMDEFNMFSPNPKVCKVTQLGPSRFNYRTALLRGIELKCFSYPEESIYRIQVPLPMFMNISNSPCVDYLSSSVSKSDIDSQLLCEISRTIGPIRIHYEFIQQREEDRSGNIVRRGKKTYFYFNQGRIEYCNVSSI